jgi:hypothetical protein
MVAARFWICAFLAQINPRQPQPETAVVEPLSAQSKTEATQATFTQNLAKDVLSSTFLSLMDSASSDENTPITDICFLALRLSTKPRNTDH